jgi:hypothetical protein
MGMLSGAFLYVTVFAPTYKSDLDTPEAEVAGGVFIEGQMYGACEEMDSCASFRLLDSRAYDYLPYPDTEVERGKIPSAITEPLFDALASGALFELSEDYDKEVCASDGTGLDFSYTVSMDDESAVLDTCSTLLATDEQTTGLFLDAWNFMQNPTTTYPEILEKGVGEYIIDSTFERFHEGEPESQE